MLRNNKDPKACYFDDVTLSGPVTRPYLREKLSEYGHEATLSCHGLLDPQTTRKALTLPVGTNEFIPDGDRIHNSSQLSCG
jgi:hypothetical protein